MYNATSKYLKRCDARVQEYEELLNGSSFLEDVQNAQMNPDRTESKQLVKKLRSMYTIIGAKVDFTQVCIIVIRKLDEV